MATESLGAADLEHASTGMPQLDISTYPNMIFWLLVALVALYFILSRFALPRIAAVLAERNDAIANDLEEASLFKRRAEEAEAAYNAALATARSEAQKIAADTKAAINAELAQLMAKADAEIAAKSAESEGRIRAIQESATRSVEEVALETAQAIVEAFVPKAADAEAVSAAVSNRLKG
ncbi:MAG: ATP F0F1 synthase subunit B' [Rhodovulum sulfidophilum]|uniref:ATP synthase subunit b n=1 Tax=Rhodovulum sulfidophilum TaxID=35806 RepID=A0A2W5PPR3_RHOSU|nr:MAG: ATP F0F1 synthase subunit B' [Rhodovulum sulfidophilum]